jgi:hypothetical protein
MSSAEEFFDVLYLGIFGILSPAFDPRFQSKMTQSTLIEEAEFAIRHFHSLLHNFSLDYIILLEGEVVTYTYVVDRMLAEFAAAVVAFAEAIAASEGDPSNVESGNKFSVFASIIEGILQDSYFHVFPYYSRCLASGYKDFTWIGPEVIIVPRSKDVLSLIPLMTKGELLDLPGHSLYRINPDVATPDNQSPTGKRHDREEDAAPVDQTSKKKKS